MIINDQLLDQIHLQACGSERLRMNFNLHDSLDAKAQRLLNALEPGTIIPIHRHPHTAESYLLLRGHLNVLFFDESGGVIERYTLDPQIGNYGIHIPAGQWHSLEVVTSSVIFEVKDGPYLPLSPQDIME